MTKYSYRGKHLRRACAWEKGKQPCEDLASSKTTNEHCGLFLRVFFLLDTFTSIILLVFAIFFSPSIQTCLSAARFPCSRIRQAYQHQEYRRPRAPCPNNMARMPAARRFRGQP